MTIGNLLERSTGCSVFIYLCSSWLIQMNVSILLPINHLCDDCKTCLYIHLLNNEGWFYGLIWIHGPATLRVGADALLLWNFISL